MSAGDVALVFFPFSQNESEPFKKRPVLVVADQGTPPDQALLVMMITGNPRRFSHPKASDIPITEWQAAGLDKESVLRTMRLWTAEGRDVDRVLGRVDLGTLEAARAAVRALVD